MQLADIHILDHDVDDADCEICLFAADLGNDNFKKSDEIILYTPITPFHEELILSKSELYISSKIDYSQSNKAPPLA